MSSPIAQLFDSIAVHYDLLNHLLSLDIDKSWRRKALKGHINKQTSTVLDVACGTGDFALQLVKAGAHQVIGIDISPKMVEAGRKKIHRKQLEKQIDLQTGDCAHLQFDNQTFDAITVAFGVRNFEQRTQSLKEMYRVLKPQGQAIILEFSTPNAFPVKQLYKFYFKHILPVVGGCISGNKNAYIYLPNSVYAFPQGNIFLQEMAETGFSELSQRRFTFGIASVYYGTKN